MHKFHFHITYHRPQNSQWHHCENNTLQNIHLTINIAEFLIRSLRERLFQVAINNDSPKLICLYVLQIFSFQSKWNASFSVSTANLTIIPTYRKQCLEKVGMHHNSQASDRYKNTAAYIRNHLRMTNKIKIFNSFHTKDVCRWGKKHTQRCIFKEVCIDSLNNYLSTCVLDILLGAKDS